MDKVFIPDDNEKAEYGSNCMDKCEFLKEYLCRYKDYDEAQERLAIERCEECVLNHGKDTLS